MNEKRLSKLLILPLLLATGCMVSYPQYDKVDDDKAGNKAEVAEASELFTQQPDGSYKFETNDTSYLKASGYTIWTMTEQNGANDEFKGVNVSVVKQQGKTGYGYGVVFNGHTAEDGTSSMLCVMIRITGEYAVGKVVNGLYKDIQWWTASGSLKSGLGAENKIEIKKTNSANEYAVRFNDSPPSETFVFTDSVMPIYQNGGSGYVVVLAPDENFPENRVEVTFKPGSN